ncbi:MAG: ATPase, T2SS/T4P/T4SS family [Candidatus Ozemobacteraceae bacterium]
MNPRRRIGELLIDRGLVLPDQVEETLRKQQELGMAGRSEPGNRLGDLLTANNQVDEHGLYKALAEQWGLPFVDSLTAKEIEYRTLESQPLEHLRRSLMFPLKREADGLTVITAEPGACGPLDELALQAGVPLRPIVAPPGLILSWLHEHYGRGKGTDEVIEDLTIEGGLEDDWDSLQVEDVLASANKAPVVKFVNTMIFQALRERASDIHLEPSPDAFRIRYRIDGILFERFNPPRHLHPPIASRIKIMAGLDIAERRLPQDGKVRVRFGDREVDIRVSCVPSAHGERVVLRLLDRRNEILTLEQMGMEEDTLKIFDQLIRRPNGLLLVTGPTGSGKTTTLYGAIMRILSPDLNIITLEDPVEYELKGANQIPVKPKIGFTFAAGLRSILRQDPDVIMVGEIRDEETATMAIQSSLTGHLVFSTLHTNDAPSATVRLIDMKVEPYLAASTLIGVLAQRLIRRLCQHCRKPTPEDGYRPVGCEICGGNGYRGRLGIFELMPNTEELSSMVASRASLDRIRAEAIREGMRQLIDDGRIKVKAGLTSREEVDRVCLMG